jgi:hypothetical protein
MSRARGTAAIGSELSLIEVCLMGHRTLWTTALVLGFAVSLAAAQDKGKTMTAVGAVIKISETTLALDTGKGGTLELMTTAETAVRVAVPSAGRSARCGFGEGYGFEGSLASRSRTPCTKATRSRRRTPMSTAS